MMRKILAFVIAFMMWGAAAQAANLYISEFPNGVSQIGSATAQRYPQAAITDQVVPLSGASARSAAFNAQTRAVMLTCDQGCSVVFGGSSVTAATTNFLLQQGVPYTFAVSPGTYVAAIANAAGTLPGGGGGGGGAVTVSAASRSAMTTAGCTVGTSSAQCLAASTANTWLQVQNTSASAQIACSWTGTAALNSNSSFMLQPGQSASWGLQSSGVPTNALSCIASAASTPLYLEYR